MTHVRFTILFLILSVITGCLPKQEVLRNPHAGRGGPSSRPGAISQTGLEYIARYHPIAIEEMHLHGIPASIKLAQGILESGSGNSRLAREANNHFGIKCASDWKGPRVYHDDDEKNDCFRSYASPEESFRDHSRFLLRRRYEKLFTLDRHDYRGWARGLKEAGYATNPRYAELLIDLIERYELYQYDQPDNRVARAQREAVVNREIRENTAAIGTATEPTKKAVAMRIHEVASGETVEQIAARYGLTVAQLREINGLTGRDLHPGQLLVVSQ